MTQGDTNNVKHVSLELELPAEAVTALAEAGYADAKLLREIKRAAALAFMREEVLSPTLAASMCGFSAGEFAGFLKEKGLEVPEGLELAVEAVEAAGRQPAMEVEPPRVGPTLDSIAGEVRECTRCGLHSGRTNAVPGMGPPDADIMFIGEGPGFHEDRQGLPFVGAAGKFLEELLADIGLRREDVFIANVIKCRPPGNRDPQPEELEACRPYLEQQIQVIRPKVIVTLGRFSMYRYFPGASISKIHGQAKRFGNVLVVPMFHPAAALHQPKWRPVLKEDFAKLPGFIVQATAFGGEDEPPAVLGEQLSMF